jgi:transposase
MPSQQARPIHLSPIQHELLQRMVHRAKSEQRLVKRAHIILAAAQGTSNTTIAHQWQVDDETVRRWRDRWHAAQSRLQVIEAAGKPKRLSQAIEVLLTAEPRPGAPATCTFAQFMQIMAASV